MNSSFTFLLIILFSSFFSINSSNLRKVAEFPESSSLFECFPIVYESLQKELKSQRTTMKSSFNLAFFKNLESTGNIKYYLNKEEKDFDSIIQDISALMGVSDSKRASVNDLFESLILRYKKNKDLDNWMNFNIITTVRKEKNSIAYGSLFALFKDGKYYFIFCYGYGNFNIEYNAQNAVLLGDKPNYRYLATSVTATYYSKDLEYFNSQYLVLFMNLVGFKVFGNKNNMDLPEPKLE